MTADAHTLRARLTTLRALPVASSIAPALDVVLMRNTAPTVAEMDALLGPIAGVRFEVQGPKRRGGPIDLGKGYDGSISERGVVPSREGSLHDVLNALVWASFPKSKRRLHDRQLAAQRAHVPAGATKLPNARAREQDVLAMLDEGGLLLTAASLGEADAALQGGDVAAIARVIGGAHVFGHATLEHLAEDRPGDPRAATYLFETTADLDGALAARLAERDSFRAPTAWPAIPVRALFSALNARPPGLG